MALVGLSIAVPAISQPPGKAEPIIWNLGWQRSECTVTTGDPAALGISLRMTPGTPEASLYIVGSQDLLPSNVSGVTVVVEPSGATFQSPADDMVVSNSRVLRLNDLGYRFPSAFRDASALRLVAHSKSITIPTVGADQAMAALDNCIAAKLVEWGVDANAWSALRQPPTNLENYAWITPDDYPVNALRQNSTGQVVARLQVDATGKVTDCAIVVSSGRKSLDNITCERAMEKGRFNPAIAADGRPTAASRIVNINFTLGPVSR